MNKKITIISAGLLVVLVLVLVIVLTSRQNPKNTVSLLNNHYYVEKGMENYVKIAKPAVENYATQNINEPLNERNRRLAKYFSADSPVYGYGLENVDKFITKSSAMMTSATEFGGEDNDMVLSVITQTTFYSGSNSVSSKQKFYITLRKINDKIEAVDIESDLL